MIIRLKELSFRVKGKCWLRKNVSSESGNSDALRAAWFTWCTIPCGGTQVQPIMHSQFGEVGVADL